MEDDLERFNLQLRQHFENFPKHYNNNPRRLPGQGGGSRKPMSRTPIKVEWSEGQAPLLRKVVLDLFYLVDPTIKRVILEG